MLVRGILISMLASLAIGTVPVFALGEMERTTITSPRLENAFGESMVDNINVNQQIQVSADITNHQDRTQDFVYIVQIKDKKGFVVSLGWISGQFSPDQKFNPSLSWTPISSGEYVAEIFVWEGLINHKALGQHTTMEISVS